MPVSGSVTPCISHTATSPVCISCQTRSALPSPSTSSTFAMRHCSGTALATGPCLTIAPSISQTATSPVCMSRQTIRFAIAINVVHTDDLPRQGHTRCHDRSLADGRPVHEPHRHIPRLRVAPDQIGFAIAVEIADADDVPRQRHAGRHEGHLRHSGAVHQPEGHIPRLRVAPDQIGFAVAIDVADPHDLPRERHTGRDDRSCRRCCAVHQPDGHVPRQRVAPHQIAGAVAIDVADANNVPRQRDAARHHGTLFQRGAAEHVVHQPDRHVAGLRLTPHQIGFAVAIDVARHRARHPDPPDLVPGMLGEPEVAVRAGRDPISVAAARRGKEANGGIGSPGLLNHVAVEQKVVWFHQEAAPAHCDDVSILHDAK